MKEIWLPPKELAGQYNLPKTVQGVSLRAKKDNWNKRKAKGKKGGGYEYEVSAIIDKFKFIQKYESANMQPILPENTDITECNFVTLKFDSERYVLVPELNVQVAAGNGVYPLTEEQIGQFVFSRYWLEKEGLSNAKLAIFHVVGDSMETTINDGDIVLINVKEEGWTGALNGVFIILVNDLLMVKRIQYDMLKNGFHIKSDNPVYDPYFIKPDDGLMFKVVAKVERVLTKMRPTKQL